MAKIADSNESDRHVGPLDVQPMARRVTCGAPGAGNVTTVRRSRITIGIRISRRSIRGRACSGRSSAASFLSPRDRVPPSPRPSACFRL